MRTLPPLARRTGRLLACALTACVLLLSGCAASVPENTAASTQYSSTVDLTNEVNTAQLPDSSFLYDASIADLANATSYMNGQTVQITGEVVGDRIFDEYDGDFCWITLQETGGAYSEMAIYLPKGMSSIIDSYGSYGRQGSILQVRGTFNLACKDHDGVTCLHATHAAKIAPGKDVDIPHSPTYLAVGSATLILGLGLVALHRILKEREL